MWVLTIKSLSVKSYLNPEWKQDEDEHNLKST